MLRRSDANGSDSSENHEHEGANKPETDKTKTKPFTVSLSDTNYMRFHETPNKVDLYQAFERTEQPLKEFDAWLSEQTWNEAAKAFVLPIAS